MAHRREALSHRLRHKRLRDPRVRHPKDQVGQGIPHTPRVALPLALTEHRDQHRERTREVTRQHCGNAHHAPARAHVQLAATPAEWGVKRPGILRFGLIPWLLTLRVPGEDREK